MDPNSFGLVLFLNYLTVLDVLNHHHHFMEADLDPLNRWRILLIAVYLPYQQLQAARIARPQLSKVNNCWVEFSSIRISENVD